MRDLDATFISEKNKAENQPLFLYTLYDYNGSSDNLYYTAYDTDVVFDGQTYTKFPIIHETIGENAEGQIDIVKVRIANVNRVMQGYLEQYDLRGKRVDITEVFANQLSDADVKSVNTFYIDSYTANEEVVEFTLSSKFDVQDVEIPQRKFTRNYCQWKFKSTECGYAGAESTCNKTKATCKTTMNNYARFGGFPSIPSQRVVIG